MRVSLAGLSLGAILAAYPTGAAEPAQVIPWSNLVVEAGAEDIPVTEATGDGRPHLEGRILVGVMNQSEREQCPKACTARFTYGHFQISRRERVMKCASRYVIPPLAEGELFPLFGGVWRANKDTDGRFDLSAVAGDKLPAGIPAVDRYAILLPMSRGHGEGTYFDADNDDRQPPPGKNGGGMGGGCQLHLRSVETVVRWEKTTHTAAVSYRGKDGPQEAKVTVGDILLVGNPVNAGLVVKAVVPADKKTKVIGWVELSGVYTPLDEVEQVAKDEKRTVVKFEKEEDRSK